VGCLAEDDVLDLARGRALGDAPTLEAHLAGCAACSALVAAVVAAADAASAADTDHAKWGAFAGRQLGPYKLGVQIGAGGMGAVYRGHDDRLKRDVAIKLVADDRQLAIEARAAAAIAHPNVVAVHDVGSAEGLIYIVQELVDGESLRSVIDKGPLPKERVVKLGIELAAGLAAAHARGVVHRDLKPENLVIASDGALKILDFGLARVGTDGALDETEPSAVRGTLGYMAPEQARGESVDARADLFAAGAILYELATGTRAFGGASHAERLTAVLRDEPPPIDGELGVVIARCMEKDVRRRFQSAQDLGWVLERTGLGPRTSGLESETKRISRRGVLIGAGAAAATGVVGYLVGRRGGGAAVTKPPSFRQLTFRHGRVMDARFTQDGASVLYGAAWEGGTLAAYALRIDTGATRPLDVPGADVLAVSRREVAIGIDRKHVAGQCATGTLAIVPLDGGVPRVIAEDVQDADFTPDGEQLAIVRRGGNGFTLELPLGTVLVDEARWLTRPRVSPDGKRIAFLRHVSNDDDRGEVMVVERATGAVRSLTRQFGSVAGLAWDPGGELLWFTADELGANNAVRTVTLAGDERTVAATTGRLRIHDVARDRRVALTLDAWRLRTMVGTPGGAEIDRSQSEFSFVTDLSADGKTLLVAEFGDLEAANGSYLRPVDAGDGLRVGSGFPIALSPDGTRVIAKHGERPGAVVYSTRSGGEPELPVGAITHVSWARWLDDRRLVIAGSTPTEAPRMWRVAIDGDPPVALTEPGVAGQCHLDGARARGAFIGIDHRLGVIDVANPGVRWLPGAYPDHVVCGWLATGEIVVRTTTTPLRLRKIAPATGAASPLFDITPAAVGLKAVDSLVLRPDAGLYAYSYGQELSQLFLMS
jgi:eukaryotic-like serine/threonine-protein kinase